MATLVQLLVFACLLLAVSCDFCYDDLGCFDTSLKCHDRKANTPAEIKTSFKVYTRQNRGNGDSLNRNDLASITASRANTRVVGREIAKLIEDLNAATGAGFGSMHIIGHSLGAHIGGYAGEACSGTVGRVTGLDPAGPDFAGDLDKSCRLDKTDARFVDVMHTDGEILIGGGLGLMDELGHQDFYPNNGQEMPGCGGISPTCDHSKAVEYFISSISSSCSFTATKKGSTWDDLKTVPGHRARAPPALRWGTRRTLARGRGHSILRPTRIVHTASKMPNYRYNVMPRKAQRLAPYNLIDIKMKNNYVTLMNLC
ncbi:pancreatic triacylglycerol lipase [Strongylocentrotus purpuratus]|uniref:Lipase domain-containing protein n=1 Tax=Strongylocentrotus purpuratus TaxID=7668 RepID=A0A7M7NXE1_STRPU|nr:pancreatic triacylglycerol lipase [Strongylocentrotus purpuratus]